MPLTNLGGGPPKKKPFGGMPPPPFGATDEKAPPAAPLPVEKAPPPAAPPPPAPSSDGQIPPEAVCYRSEMEVCGSCTYNAGGNCDRLAMPVSDGDSCNLFEDRGDGMDMTEEADELEPAA